MRAEEGGGSPGGGLPLALAKSSKDNRSSVQPNMSIPVDCHILKVRQRSLLAKQISKLTHPHNGSRVVRVGELGNCCKLQVLQRNGAVEA